MCQMWIFWNTHKLEELLEEKTYFYETIEIHLMIIITFLQYKLIPAKGFY